MQFAHWLVIAIILETGSSIRLTVNDIRNIYKARMNKKTFEIAKNLHLNWYIYAIKALLGQVGKQMYQQLTKGWLLMQLDDKQKMLASCLDQIEDDRDLVASAKCLVQARRRRYFSTCREDFQQGQASNESSDTPAFITISDSEKKEEVPFKNRDYKKKNMGRHHQTVTREETFHISRSGFENKPSKRHSSSKQFLRFSNILDFNHMKNFTPHNFNAFKHLTDPISVSESSNQQKFRISKETYLNRLLPVDKKSGHLTSMLKKHSTGKNETSETLYLIENEIKRSTNHIGQSPNFSHYQKNGRTEKHSKKPELVKKINLPERSRNFKKSDRKKKLWQRRRRSYRLITNRAMKSDHLIIDVGKGTYKRISKSKVSKFEKGK
ncbi:unnamed protein product, partial [Acanthocheilonema viteae]